MTVTQADIDTLHAAASAEESSTPEAVVENRGAANEPGQPASVPQSRKRTPQIERILNISVPVAVMLAERDMPVETILDIRVGTIIEFDVPFDSELTLLVTDHPIGAGHAVKLGENFGLRVSAIDSVEERIDAMGGE